MIKIMVGYDLTLTSNSKIDLARLPPCFRNLLPQINRVNHRLAFYKRVNEPFIEATNPYEDKQGLLKTQNQSPFGTDLASRIVGRHRR